MRNQGNDYGKISNLICEEAIELGVPDNVTLQVINARAYFEAYRRQLELEQASMAFISGSQSDSSSAISSEKGRIRLSSGDSNQPITPIHSSQMHYQ